MANLRSRSFPPDNATEALAGPGTTLSGRRAGPLDSILPNSKETIGELTKTVAAVRKLLEDQKLRSNVESLMASSKLTMDKFAKLAGDVSSTLTSNRGNIDRAIAAATNAVQDVRRITLRVAEMANDDRFKGRLAQIIGRVETIEKHTDDLVENLNKLVNDPTLRAPASRIAANVDEITKTGKSIAAHTDAMTKNGEEVSKNAIEISRNLGVVSKKAITLTDTANQVATNALDMEGAVERRAG